MRVADDCGREMTNWMQIVHKEVKQSLLESGLFSPIQKDILSYVSSNRNGRVGIKNIASGMDKEEGNIKIQCTRIRDKINAAFKTNYINSVDAVASFMRQGLLFLAFFFNHSLIDFLMDNSEELTDLVNGTAAILA